MSGDEMKVVKFDNGSMIAFRGVKAVRGKLPPEREGLTHAVTIGGQKVYIRTGEYEDGEIGEVFVTIDK